MIGHIMFLGDLNKVKRVDEKLLNSLKKKIEVALQSSDVAPIAAFDADGTLWAGDAGEVFFQYQLDHCHLPNLPEDPWDHYVKLKDKDARSSCVWLAQINEGQTEGKLREWAHACFKSGYRFAYYEDQKSLIQWLKALGVDVYVVTASIKWAVEPGAQFMGVDQDHVIGIQTKKVDGKLTREARPPVTYGPGKKEAILQITNGKKPIFATGNSMGDAYLLDCAQVAFAVMSQHPGELHYESELKLKDKASSAGWDWHRFY